MASRGEATRVKRRVAQLLRGDDNVAGIGLTKVGEEDFAVRVSLVEASGSVDVPDELDGVRVVVRTVGRVAPL